MGTDDTIGFPEDGEGPVREVFVESFQLSAHVVTNEQFAMFAQDTGYVTQAEEYGWSFVFAGFLSDTIGPTRAVVGAPWWRQVFGAQWRHPLGPDSSIAAIGDHPVVHVSWNDAIAYCHWDGSRLPTEAEWEYAARGGLVQKRYVWGDELQPNGVPMCNIFQGTFPNDNTAEDGYEGTAPVDAYAPNGFGLYNMAGNVWEWCCDTFSTDHMILSHERSPSEAADTSRAIRGGS